MLSVKQKQKKTQNPVKTKVKQAFLSFKNSLKKSCFLASKTALFGSQNSLKTILFWYFYRFFESQTQFRKELPLRLQNSCLWLLRVSKIVVFCFCECKIVFVSFKKTFSLSLSRPLSSSLSISLSPSRSLDLSLSLSLALSLALSSRSLSIYFHHASSLLPHAVAVLHRVCPTLKRILTTVHRVPTLFQTDRASRSHARPDFPGGSKDYIYIYIHVKSACFSKVDV